MSNYKKVTVQDIVNVIKSNPDKFKDGMDTLVFSGDFEGNYTHHFHEISYDNYGDKNVIFLGYEMHEDCGR